MLTPELGVLLYTLATLVSLLVLLGLEYFFNDRRALMAEYNQARATLILETLEANGGTMAMASLITATGLTPAQFQEQRAIMEDATNPDNTPGVQMISVNPTTNEVTALISSPAPSGLTSDQMAVDCIINVACAPPVASGDSAINDVADAVGNTMAEIQRGLDNAQRLIDGLRCDGLRDKLIAKGISGAEADAMLDSVDDALETASAWTTAYQPAP